MSVQFFDEAAEPCSVILDGSLSVRETVRLVDAAGNAGGTQTTDGQFSFDTESATAAPIHCLLSCTQTEIRGRIEYVRSAWEPATVESFAAAYQRLLRAAIADPDIPIGQLEALTDSDLQLLDIWNRTDAHYPHLRVDQMFQQRVEEAPNDPAVTFEGKSITYGGLSSQTSRLAARLREAGVGPGAIVAVCMDRCSEMVAALLAVFRAGGGYLPLDPAFPLDRVAFMLEDARPLAIITQPHLLEKFAFAAEHVLVLDSLEPAAASDCVSEIPALPDSSLDDLAYVLYTSGSTGKPKGVQITHRALTNLLTSVAPSLPIGKSDVLLATSTISFDISVFEIFAPLICGAHLVVAPRSTAVNGELLGEAIRASGATLLQATPSGWRVLVEAGWQGQAGLKMLTAGEPLDRTLARRLLARGAGLWNLYGPTEATIYATGRKISQDDAKITVGEPLANYKTYILDRNGKRVPVGAIGELYLGGVGVGLGYLNRPELTSEKFTADPFTQDTGLAQDGGRVYKTGDLARFWPDGQIELLGRADNQIKLRGYRIELEEIEAVLDSHADVHKAVVKVITLDEGDQRLAAYYVPRIAGLADEAHLREFALRTLPWYAVPAAFFPVEAFALTPNGKVDRKALPAFQPARITAVAGDAAADELELTIVRCWRTILNLPHLSLDDNFFLNGGHSLLAARMFTQLGEQLELKLPVSVLVEAPTPRLFAERIRKTRHVPARCLVPMQTKGSLPPLYFIHHLFGDVLVYRTLAECFAPERPVVGVQAPVGLVDREEPCSLEFLAAEYIKELQEQQATGPYHLAGFSSGGLLAFEMARQLTQAGHEVGLVAIIDGEIQAPGPALSKPARYTKVALRKLCKIAFKLQDELKEGPKQFVGKRVRYVQLLWRLRRLKSKPASNGSKLTLEQTLMLAENAYRPGPYAGPALLLRFQDEAWQFGPDPLMGWGSLVQGRLEVVDFPGGHLTGMSPSRAHVLADVLKARMEKV